MGIGGFLFGGVTQGGTRSSFTLGYGLAPCQGARADFKLEISDLKGGRVGLCAGGG